ncbi:MAG: SDR family oxidoreductase [Lunatimonas sp.]|uniref:SDR family oxidoreductase n=1 Tax=Lunatimonas sp. TaxID=2060141 RepID=UPI00263A6810|nr:SDR family oxidoreductase [Lunatimonas sp.]MCC5939682.1 SDR family oxidoreductase [Lunatimonas sp.]
MNTPKQNRSTILITGANGLLGQKLVEQAASNPDYRVIATGKGECRLPKEDPNFEYVQMDASQKDDIDSVFKQYHPNIVIHAASMTDVDRCEIARDTCFTQNVEATKWITEACTNHKSHLIYLSTDFIFDGKEGPYDESAKPNPLNYYGWTKMETERLVQKATCSWSIVRTNLVYGTAHDLSRSNIVLWVKHGLENGKELNLVDDQLRTPTLAEDLAYGCLLIAEKHATGIFNISGKDLLTPYDMAMLTAEHFGLDQTKIIRTDSSHFSQVAKRPLRTGLIIDKARRILDYQPKSFVEGIAIVTKQFNLAKSK